MLEFNHLAEESSFEWDFEENYSRRQRAEGSKAEAKKINDFNN
jgi:hypothetical protein